MMYGHGLVDKNYFFDEAVHTPFIIRLPGSVKPGRYDDLIESTDVLASIFEICEINVPYSNQGKSFASYITDGVVGSEYIPRKYVCAENIIPEIITDGVRDFRYEKGKGVKGIRHPDAKMIRSKKWKYNYYIDSEELYDLENDPAETINLADNNKYSEIIRDLRKKLLDWMITADETDQIAPAWFNVKDENGNWSLWNKWKG
jgi:arylsulfatase A-like enzyme